MAISSSDKWWQIYNQVPLSDVPRHFAGIAHSPFLLEYLTEVLKRCPRDGATALEAGCGSGYASVWLSLRGVVAEGFDLVPQLVERARQVNNSLEGLAAFRTGNLFRLWNDAGATEPATQTRPRFNVIHHQGVLEHFTVPQMRAALAQQVALADWVVFSVPSVYYPFEPEMGDERLLPLEEWKHILEPFTVEDLRYYGDPQLGGREHVLCVLRGHPEDTQDDLLALMAAHDQPFPQGISAIVHTRNEARHIKDCLESLKGWTDEIIVCDMESADDTVALARDFATAIVHHPLIANFDRARNVSALRARYRWVFYLDADERVPPALGVFLRQLITTQGDSFEAALPAFRHHFARQWLQCLYPGYTAPRLLKNGRFVWSARPHAGAEVDGRLVLLPADDPNLALVHHSFDGLAHYLDKLNRYTDSESANLYRDGQPFHWRQAIKQFVEDFSAYYDDRAAHRDGVHGFLYSLLSGFYRFEQNAKLYEHRYRAGRLTPPEQEVPQSVEEVLEFALAVVRQSKQQAPALAASSRPLRIAASGGEASSVARVAWTGPLRDPSGYGEECRNFLFALDDAGVNVAAQSVLWSVDEVDMPPVDAARLDTLSDREVQPGFVQIIQNFPPAFEKHPNAGIAIGRTMFETDRLPPDWVTACNKLDYIWVPSEFNRRTFAAAGVRPEKLVVIPGCYDPSSYDAAALKHEDRKKVKGIEETPFVFLSVFDWTRHKGWDVLLRGFIEEFGKKRTVDGRPLAQLVLKVWSTMGYSAEEIKRQAEEEISRVLGEEGVKFLQDSDLIRFLTTRLTRLELLDLYANADAYVLPSRGEGWGRPYLEAMAIGLPTIGTDWSGNTAFMNEANSYLVPSSVRPIPEVGWREVPTYRGHCWAEPDRAALKERMRSVFDNIDEAAQRGQSAKQFVRERYSRAAVGKLLAAEVARVQDAVAPNQTALPKIKTDISSSKPVTLRWEGAQFSAHSLALVNREICGRLLTSDRVELSIIPTEPTQLAPEQEPKYGPTLAERVFAPLSRSADVHVRHFFPPRFERAEEGKLVLIQPWEYGYLPTDWVPAILKNVSEVWCYSNYVREVYEASGIPSAMLRVVPLGVDEEVFHPSAPPYIFTVEPGAGRLQDIDGETEETPFTFLYVGGTLHRKGIDILIEAYLSAFSPMDNVCLIVKDTGTETVYRGQNQRDRLLELATDTTRPKIVYLDEEMSAHRLAGVYTASNCLVQPYRGEGFCLPALEAMACGIPVIVPAGGPTDDFVDDTVGWRVTAKKQSFGDGYIGPYECVGATWMWEVDSTLLARQMREVYRHRQEADIKGKAAANRVQGKWTWSIAASSVLERLAKLGKVSDSYLASTIPTLNKADAETVAGQIFNDASGTGNLPHLAPEVRSAPTISLCMIVRNEERVLADCLRSAQPWVDEIILVDTGSLDRTLEIAHQYNARIFHFPWCDDFSAARNESLAHATSDWILWMDADDTLPELCGQALRELVMRAEKRTTGFLMQVHIPPAPNETGFTVVDHVKVFRNYLGLQFEGRIHEQVLESIQRIDGRVERSDLHVVHSGYDYSDEGQERKRERDLTILEKDLLERPNHPFVWFNIGMTAFHLKQYEKASEALVRCLELAKPRESIVRKVYAMLAGCEVGIGKPAAASMWVEKGLQLFPRDPELLFRAGGVFHALGDMSKAEEYYKLLINEPETGHIDSIDISITGYKARHNLALLYMEMGRFIEAEQEWLAVLAEQPGFTPSILGLEQLFVKINSQDKLTKLRSQKHS